MSLLERQVLAEPGLLAVLPAGDTARAYAAAAQTGAGAVRDEPYGTSPARPPREGPIAFLSGAWMPRWARGDRIDRWFGGVSRWGTSRSLGARMHTALEAADGVVVTDRSLLVVTGTVLRQDIGVAWSCAAADVVAARRRGRLAGRGRVELVFADRSMCAVMTGLVRASAARRLLAALDVPQEPPAG